MTGLPDEASCVLLLSAREGGVVQSCISRLIGGWIPIRSACSCSVLSFNTEVWPVTWSLNISLDECA
jgi:hypothetical protein